LLEVIGFRAVVVLLCGVSELPFNETNSIGRPTAVAQASGLPTHGSVAAICGGGCRLQPTRTTKSAQTINVLKQFSRKAEFCTQFLAVLALR
jgi:hypothetical protein